MASILIVMGLFVWLVPLQTQAEPYTTTRYVRIDHKAHTAYLYDEQFVRLPDAPDKHGTSVEFLPEASSRWFLGSEVDVVRRSHDASIQIVSTDPAYSEMVHHFYMRFFTANSTPGGWQSVKSFFRPYWHYARSLWCRVTLSCTIGDCSVSQWVKPETWFLVTGSELTDYHLPSGYGFRVDGDYIRPDNWHWENPAGVPQEEEVYLRLVIYWDNDPSAYRDTYVTYILADPCWKHKFTFCVKPGMDSKAGPEYKVDKTVRLLGVLPHVHDHSDYIELRLNGQKLYRFVAEKDAVPVAHEICTLAETVVHPEIGHERASLPQRPSLAALHRDVHHLRAGGLTTLFLGNRGPILKQGERLAAFGSFSNPHSYPIDNMVIFVVFWEYL